LKKSADDVGRSEGQGPRLVSRIPAQLTNLRRFRERTKPINDNFTQRVCG
jgi:hypothetical protein